MQITYGDINPGDTIHVGAGNIGPAIVTDIEEWEAVEVHGETFLVGHLSLTHVETGADFGLFVDRDDPAVLVGA